MRDKMFMKPVNRLSATLQNGEKMIRGVTDSKGMMRFYFNSSYQADFTKNFYLSVQSDKFSDSSFKL
jgi:hypothetical protein